MSNPMSCATGRRLAEDFAITARYYADSAAQFGNRSMSREERVQLLAVSEELLLRAASACAALKKHIDVHHCGGTCTCAASQGV